MNKRADWNNLHHIDKLKILRETALDQTVSDYKPADEDDAPLNPYRTGTSLATSTGRRNC